MYDRAPVFGEMLRNVYALDAALTSRRVARQPTVNTHLLSGPAVGWRQGGAKRMMWRSLCSHVRALVQMAVRSLVLLYRYVL